MQNLIDRLRNNPVMVLVLLGQLCAVIAEALSADGVDGVTGIQSVIVAVFAWIARARVTPV